MVKLEVGKFYRARDGRKVGPILLSGGVYYPFISDSCTYSEEGRVFQKRIMDADLIAEWQDEPVEVIGANVESFNAETMPKSLLEQLQAAHPQPRSKYHRIIKGVEVDIYDILVAWGVTCPARQHAIKKLLMAGERGAKGVAQDLDEAIQATERAKELVG